MNAFKLRRFHAFVILQCVRWYSKYTISYRQLEEMMADAASWSIWIQGADRGRDVHC
jgi:hypothetical protein